MKVLSGPEGDGLLTNAEVQAWLKEKNFEIDKRDLEKGAIRPPSSIATLSRDLRQYLEASPSGGQTVPQVKDLFEQLEKYKLSAPEKLMIANIRPEAYAHLTPLLVDVYSRFDEDQLYEMLGVINSTLPKRKKPSDSAKTEKDSEQEAATAHSADGEVISAPVDATALDITSMAISDGQQNRGAVAGNNNVGVPSGQDATILDYSSAVEATEGGSVAKPSGQQSQGSTTNIDNAPKSREDAEKPADCTILDYTSLKRS